MPETRIGISGWNYGPWRGTFYPKGLAHRRELEYASRRLNSIEINGTFYSLQRPDSFRRWYRETPEDFIFSIKGGRFITHMKKLKDVETPLANFFASGLLALKEKLGPILWQFPPGFAFDAERFESFFKLLPKTHAAAADLARRHDERLKGRALTVAEIDRPIRYAVEIRHESFRVPAFINLLRRHQVALCVADTARRFPFFEDVTTDFVYARLHGDEELYVSGYSDSALDWWANRLEAWRTGREPPDAKRAGDKVAPKHKSRDVYVYFDNDVKVRAPFDAAALGRRMGLDLPEDTVDRLRLDQPIVHASSPRQRWPGMRRRPAAAAETAEGAKPTKTAKPAKRKRPKA